MKIFHDIEQSWYLGADMQFHWIAPIILIPMASKYYHIFKLFQTFVFPFLILIDEH